SQARLYLFLPSGAGFREEVRGFSRIVMLCDLFPEACPTFEIPAAIFRYGKPRHISVYLKKQVLPSHKF
ncbi:MAG: hypothetical protein R2838_19505, partial [Caldilineaceae bacterium]